MTPRTKTLRPKTLSRNALALCSIVVEKCGMDDGNEVIVAILFRTLEFDGLASQL
jgi:hypothetical protein